MLGEEKTSGFVGTAAHRITYSLNVMTATVYIFILGLTSAQY